MALNRADQNNKDGDQKSEKIKKGTKTGSRQGSMHNSLTNPLQLSHVKANNENNGDETWIC